MYPDVAASLGAGSGNAWLLKGKPVNRLLESGKEYTHSVRTCISLSPHGWLDKIHHSYFACLMTDSNSFSYLFHDLCHGPDELGFLFVCMFVLFC